MRRSATGSTRMAELESGEFVAALQRDRDAALDAALDDVLAALHAVAR